MSARLLPGTATDPLLDADAAIAADGATTDGLLRCWLRETGMEVPPAGGLLRFPLAGGAAVLEAPVLHASASGWHRFGRPRLEGSPAPAGAAVVAALLAGEVANRGAADPSTTVGLASRALLSAERVAAHIEHRRGAPTDPTGPVSFLAAEQALLLGHPFHPTPKSRPGAAERDLLELSPELRGELRLRWFAAHPSVVSMGSSRAGLDPLAVLGALAEGVEVPQGWAAIPVHPWQAQQVLGRDGVAELLDRGLLRDVGPGADRWSPTSSLRTVFRDGAPVMLKLALGLRITNSRREHLRHELALGLQADRLLDAFEPALRAAHPSFRVLRDAAWAGVDPTRAGPESGLEVVLRDSPFRATDPVACLAGLVAERPEGGGTRLGALLRASAARGGGDVADRATEWVMAFVDRVAAPVLWLLETHGLGLEAHQQNLLVGLDADGLPASAWYRDSQGFYVTESHEAGARAAVADLGAGCRAVFADRLVEDRVLYYLGVNALLGIVGALGAEGLADERALLRAARTRLAAVGGSAARRLLHDAVLPCKANLLTCADGRDELDGAVETQSVYVDVANPLAQVQG